MGSPALAAPDGAEKFFDAALCKPPLNSAAASSFYQAAEKLAKYETVGLIAVYKLPAPISSKDGLTSQELVLSKNSVGVLLEGLQAEALAKRLQLKADRPSILRAAIVKGYSRPLEAAEQPSAEDGVVSIAARESKTFPGKTMLVCEMLTHSEIKAIQSY